MAQHDPEGGPERVRRRAASQIGLSAPSAAPVKNDELVRGGLYACATVLVGPRRSWLDGLARLLEKTAFRVIASAVNVERPVLNDLRYKLLILDAGHDVETALRKVRLFKALHEAGRIVVILTAPRWADIMSFFNAGAHACLPENVATETLLKSLELVILGETFASSTLLPSIPSFEMPSTPAD
jgi:DNA-binding NarL/FixJ family response regulator